MVSISLQICDGPVIQLTKFLSEMLFSETSTKVAVPCVKLVSERFSSLSENCVSTLLERLLLLFPVVKTVLNAKIFKSQNNRVESK